MKTTTIKLILGVGETNLVSEISNNHGKIIGAFVSIANPADLPADNLIAAITDTNSRAFAELPLRSWEQRNGGSFMDSMVPLNIMDSNIQFQLNTATAPTTAVVFSLVLQHENNQSC